MTWFRWLPHSLVLEPGKRESAVCDPTAFGSNTGLPMSSFSGVRYLPGYRGLEWCSHWVLWHQWKSCKRVLKDLHTTMYVGFAVLQLTYLLLAFMWGFKPDTYFCWWLTLFHESLMEVFCRWSSLFIKKKPSKSVDCEDVGILR